MFAIICVSTARVIGKMIRIMPEQISEYLDIMQSEKYEELPVAEMLGDDGYLFILDEQNQIIYQSNADINVPDLSEKDLYWIPEYTTSDISSPTVSSQTYIDENNQTFYIVTVYTWETDKRIVENIYVLNETYDIIYSTNNECPYDKLTDNEYLYLSDTSAKDYSLTKYSFTTDNGTKNTMLIYISRTIEDRIYQKLNRVLSDSVLWFMIFYLITIAIFIFWMTKKVKKPLRLLHNALEAFNNGERGQQINYSGMHEFVQICSSFNELSRLLTESENRRKQLEKERQEMLTDISHDLKTPITIIQGYSKAIQDGLVSTEELPNYLNAIEVKAETLNELINAFHEYSKLEHPDFMLSAEPCDMCIFLRDYLANQYNDLSISGYQLDVDIPELHIVCNIDQMQMKRALSNILSNSIKYSPKGTILFCTLTVLSSENKNIRIVLADNGPGIPQNMAEKIFEPFVVGETSRSHQGSGLGLAICKKIIEAHKGTVRLISPPEEQYKTEFEILLPISEKHDVEKSSE